jgi:hypothetical protein
VHSEELPDDVQHTKERKPDVLKKITDKNGDTFVLHIEWQGEFATLRYIQQLQILSQLRIFKPENIAIMESVASWYKIERDPAYQLGQKQGIEKGIAKGQAKEKLAVVKALLLNTNHTISEIAHLVIPLQFICIGGI